MLFRSVVVQVRARPINPADTLLLTGRHLYRPDLPAPVGIEGAGEVVAAGSRSRLAVGALVAIPFGGTWRERIALGDDDVLPLPPGIDREQAAMLSVNPFTAAGLLEGLGAGDWIVANAAASAVVGQVLALAVPRGVNVVAVARDGRAEARLLGQGARAFVLDGPGLPERVARVAGGRVVRALDAVAGDRSVDMFACVADGGELVVYGLLGGDVAHLRAAELVFRDVTVRGWSRLRALRAMAPARRTEITEHIATAIATGTLSSRVAARFPLAEARSALQAQAAGGLDGKVLLVSDG